MDSSYRRTSLMDALFVFTVAMFISASFAVPYPTLVGESPIQEFMGFTGSHPFMESTGRSSSFRGSIAYATITLSLSSSDNFKSMGPCSRVVREQQSAESSFFAFAPAPLSSLSSDKLKPMDSLSRVSQDKQIAVSTSDSVTLASTVSSSSYLKFQFGRHLATFDPSLKHFAAQLWLKY